MLGGSKGHAQMQATGVLRVWTGGVPCSLPAGKPVHLEGVWEPEGLEGRGTGDSQCGSSMGNRLGIQGAAQERRTGAEHRESWVEQGLTGPCKNMILWTEPDGRYVHLRGVFGTPSTLPFLFLQTLTL